MVAEMWEASGEEGVNPRFVRPFSDLVLELVEEFICTVQNKKSFPL